MTDYLKQAQEFINLLFQGEKLEVFCDGREWKDLNEFPGHFISLVQCGCIRKKVIPTTYDMALQVGNALGLIGCVRQNYFEMKAESYTFHTKLTDTYLGWIIFSRFAIHALRRKGFLWSVTPLTNLGVTGSFYRNAELFKCISAFTGTSHRITSPTEEALAIIKGAHELVVNKIIS